MIPPIVLDVQPGFRVLDMCAAPGSKTSQIIEDLNGQGVVVANDADHKRAFMLIHQLNRCSTSAMIVTNHQAQIFPNLGGQNKLYDRVLCDVPCSGDGALRKMPQKWKNWKVKDGYGIHGLQIQILRRALQLCKGGGYVCYSTCSLNPVEDQAVVAQVVRENREKVEIVDLVRVLEVKCPGLVVRRGMRSWKVLNIVNREMVEYGSMEDVPENFKFLKQSMFPADVPQDIVNSIRILPHDQDTGGFYICLLHKIADSEIQQEKAKREKPSKKKKVDQSDFFNVNPETPQIQNLVEYFGLDPQILQYLYSSATSNTHKNLFFVSKQTKDLICQDQQKKMKVLNLGVKAFTLHKNKALQDHCPLRPCYQALPFITPYIGKRVVHSEDFSFLTKVVAKDITDIEDLENPSEEIAETTGFFILNFRLGVFIERIPVLKLSSKTIISLIPKEMRASLKIRYAFQQAIFLKQMESLSFLIIKNEEKNQKSDEMKVQLEKVL